MNPVGQPPHAPPREAHQLLASRQRPADDPHRPRYHLSSPYGQLHDPGGLCRWHKHAHVFYIAPGGKGHAVSNDWVHWRDLPVIPSLGGMTGQILVTETQVLMTFATADGVFLARAHDPLLEHWERTLILPKDVPLAHFQNPIDTCIWRDHNTYRLAVRRHRWDDGLWHFQGTRPALALFRSENLQTWTEDGTFFEKNNALEPDEPLRLRIFLDRSIVEVFANERQCLTVRTYPSRDDSRGISLFAKGRPARLLSLTAWPMHSTQPEHQQPLNDPNEGHV